MLQVDEVSKNSWIFSEPLIQPGHGSCYNCDGKFLLWSVFTFINILYNSKVRVHVQPHCIKVARKHLFDCQGGEVLFNIIVKTRMFMLGIVPKETSSRLFNLVYLIIFLTKLLQMGCLGYAWRRMRFYLVYSVFNLKTLDLYLKTWLWSPLIWAEIVLYRGVDIWDYVKPYIFNNFVYF